MADNEAKVIEAFKKAGEPLKTGQVADTAGIETKEVGKLISPKRCYYGLP